MTTHAAAVPAANTPVSTRAERLRAAIDRAVAFAPRFLDGPASADEMAHTMVQAVRDCAEQERVAGGGEADSAETLQLQEALSELMGCGSGYLAGRCDGACVARTMRWMVREFGTH